MLFVIRLFLSQGSSIQHYLSCILPFLAGVPPLLRSGLRLNVILRIDWSYKRHITVTHIIFKIEGLIFCMYSHFCVINKLQIYSLEFEKPWQADRAD